MKGLRRLITEWTVTADQVDAAADRRRGAGDVFVIEDLNMLMSIALTYRSCAAELARVVELAAEPAQ